MTRPVGTSRRPGRDESATPMEIGCSSHESAFETGWAWAASEAPRRPSSTAVDRSCPALRSTSAASAGRFSSNLLRVTPTRAAATCARERGRRRRRGPPGRRLAPTSSTRRRSPRQTALGKVVEHHCHLDPGPADAEPVVADGGVDGDAVVPAHVVKSSVSHTAPRALAAERGFHDRTGPAAAHPPW